MSKKSELLTRAAELGVDVPDGAMIAGIEELIAAVEDPDRRVMARWINFQPVMLRTPDETRIIGYGDVFEVSAGRLAGDDNLIAADEPWTPDPALLPATTSGEKG